jgi:hypothetical protein
MKEMTLKRHALIRCAFKKMLGTMPVMRIYLELSEQFGLSDETIRKILGKKERF